MDEVFGDENFISEILVKKTGGVGAAYLDNVFDIVIWYGRNRDKTMYRALYETKSVGEGEGTGKRYDQVELSPFDVRPLSKEEKESIPSLEAIERNGGRFFQLTSLNSDSSSAATTFNCGFEGDEFYRTNWKSNRLGLSRLILANRVRKGDKTIRFRRYLMDFPATSIANFWDDTKVAGKIYVVQTADKVVGRCILMTTDPGDLVLDPTCGSGTTAFAAEQWGRRWITIDTSRVAIALARSRLMGARYPYYLLADSKEGQQKEGEITRTPPKTTPTHGSIRQGFVYDRVPHITLKSIANNSEIDVIWDRMQPAVEQALATLNAAVRGWPQPFTVTTGGRAGKKITFTTPGTVTLPSGETAPNDGFMEWEVPRDWPDAVGTDAIRMPDARQTDIRQALAAFWQARIARQREIDASIAAKAEFEFLYDKPFDDKSKVRVAGPFTVESLSPHRTLAVDWDDELIDTYEAAEGRRKAAEAPRDFTDFAHMILENLKAAGVQQAHKEDRITFTSLKGWPGNWIAAEGTFMEGDTQRRAGVFIGPEFGTVSRPDLVAAARECGDAGFDLMISCAFNYDAHSSEFDKLGRIRVLKARMNPDLHMGGDLKTTGAGNLFVIFGEPDIRIADAGDGMVQVQVFGVDVFKPQTGEVQSEGTDGIALWMLDTDYNEESSSSATPISSAPTTPTRR